MKTPTRCPTCKNVLAYTLNGIHACPTCDRLLFSFVECRLVYPQR